MNCMCHARRSPLKEIPNFDSTSMINCWDSINSNWHAVKDEIFDLYRELKLGNCDICKGCKASNNDELYDPVSIWTIGENFATSNDKILFVGKTARGGDDSIGTFIDNSFYDATTFGTNSLALDDYSSPYYSYTNEIIKRYFGSFEDGKRNRWSSSITS